MDPAAATDPYAGATMIVLQVVENGLHVATAASQPVRAGSHAGEMTSTPMPDQATVPRLRIRLRFHLLSLYFRR